MKRPMTTKEYFETICKRLSETKKLPENILDYSLPTSEAIPIKTYEFDLRNHLAYGGNEGIYLDLFISCTSSKEKQPHPLGTFKTLQEDTDAMHTMTTLLADFLIEGCSYVNQHLDDFTWEGFDIHVLKEDGTTSSWGYTCSNIETSMKRKEKLLQSYPQVVIRDNVTRKEQIYSRKGNGIE